MAQKRMLDKKISVSNQVDNLSLEAKLIFTWAIPHADDLGLIPKNPKTLKAIIIPMWDMRIDSFEKCLAEIESQGLWSVFTYKGEDYYRMVKFSNHQTLKKDRKPNTYLPDIDHWQEVEKLGFQMEDNGNPSKEKLSKDKIREVNISISDEVAEVDLNSLINLFKGINPSYKTIFSNKTQRSALNRLVKEHGVDKITHVLKEVLPETNGKPYAPTITTPLDLEKKLGALIAWVKKESAKKNNNKIITI